MTMVDYKARAEKLLPLLCERAQKTEMLQGALSGRVVLGLPPDVPNL